MKNFITKHYQHIADNVALGAINYEMIKWQTENFNYTHKTVEEDTKTTLRDVINSTEIGISVQMIEIYRESVWILLCETKAE